MQVLRCQGAQRLLQPNDKMATGIRVVAAMHNAVANALVI
jgi:hypothetical protein